MSTQDASTPGQPSHRRSSIAVEDVAHVPDVGDAITSDAAKATASETSLTLLEGLKTYPKAVGYLYALPAFQRRFGSLQEDGSYGISAAWQSGSSNGPLVGEIFGLFLTGIIAERLGHKNTMNLPMLLVGETLCGLPWGTFQTLTTTYASEVYPVALRPYLTTYVNLCWIIGQFVSSAVLKGVSEETGPLGYKIPYGLQWIWPVPLIIGIALAPESPWWLVRKGRDEDAKKQLLRLTSSQVDFDLDATISMMIYTNELEKEHAAGARYLDCFKGVNLRRTEIVTFVWAIQTLCGASSMIGFSTYFFTQAGLDTSHAFSMSLGLYALGAILMSLVLIVIGFMGIANSSSAQWAIAAMMLLFTFIYDATVGPVYYSLVAELASTRLRNKTVVLARNLYNITGLVANILTPHMLNPESWNWGAKAGFFWGGARALCAAWTFFRLPEPKGRTYAELDALFQAKDSARRFASTDVPALSGSQSGPRNDEKSLHDAEHYEVKLGSEKTAYIQST
ncbi:sugar porter family MFS transporter [Hortaea werneckii]|nr:sugar porter family MFS transporter [Hortaea werneckii]